MAVEFELLEGRIHGIRYYTIKPVFEWWNPSGLKGNSWKTYMDWCEEQFGPRTEIWDGGNRWHANNAKFWFRDESDRMLFLLRWA